MLILKKDYFCEKIVKLTQQLNSANIELSKLQTIVRQVTSYNKILVYENEKLRKKIKTLKGGRRHHSDELNKIHQIKQP
jgi:regulator of replication initiation timing